MHLFARKKNRLWKNVLFGMAGGAAGTLAMGYYWKAVEAILKQDPRKLKKPESDPSSKANISVVGPTAHAGEQATAAVGRILYETVKREEPMEQKKQKLAEAVHWGYGTLMGGVYGAMKTPVGVNEGLASLLYGAGLWLYGSELAVPLLGLSKAPTAFPAKQHAFTFGAHLVYGSVAGATRKLLSAIF